MFWGGQEETPALEGGVRWSWEAEAGTVQAERWP